MRCPKVWALVLVAACIACAVPIDAAESFPATAKSEQAATGSNTASLSTWYEFKTLPVETNRATCQEIKATVNNRVDLKISDGNYMNGSVGYSFLFAQNCSKSLQHPAMNVQGVGQEMGSFSLSLVANISCSLHKETSCNIDKMYEGWNAKNLFFYMQNGWTRSESACYGGNGVAMTGANTPFTAPGEVEEMVDTEELGDSNQGGGIQVFPKDIQGAPAGKEIKNAASLTPKQWKGVLDEGRATQASSSAGRRRTGGCSIPNGQGLTIPKLNCTRHGTSTTNLNAMGKMLSGQWQQHCHSGSGNDCPKAPYDCCLTNQTQNPTCGLAKEHCTGDMLLVVGFHCARALGHY